MAIRIVISNTVKFPVTGTIKNEAGADESFTFHLTCKRLDAEAIKARVETSGDLQIADFFDEVLQDWQGVKDADGKDLPYTGEHLRALFRIPGLAGLAFTTYLREIGAKAKN
jgi:hypothetical protein